MNLNRNTILYIGGFQMPDMNAAAHRVLANAKIFRELDYEVIFLGTSPRQIQTDVVNSIKKNFEGFTYFNLPYPKGLIDWYNYLTSISHIKQFIKSSLEEMPESIVAYNYPSIALNCLRKFCSENSIKLYADCTEWYQAEGNIFSRTIKNFDTNFRMKYVHPKLDGIIVISRYLLNYYKEKMSNIILLPPLVDAEMQKWTPSFKDYSFNGVELVYAGSPGTGAKDKLDKIINALTLIKRESPELIFRLNIIGITKDQYLTSFNINSLSDEEEGYVVFSGRLPHLETIKKIKTSNYQIFIRENNLVNLAGFPTKFAESITCGTPVLTNLTSNIGDFLSDGINGFILDISSDDKFLSSLRNALSKTIEELEVMKQNCLKDNPFDYRRYISGIKDFLARG